MINAVRLLEEVRGQGYTGGINRVRHFLRPLRLSLPAATERFENLPGQQALVDWASCGCIMHQGRLCPLWAFVLTLSYSRRQYVEFTVSHDLDTFLRCHVNGFRHFSGVPGEVLYGNLKTVVERRRAGGEVVWNKRLQDFANYYGFSPRARKPYRAWSKEKVEMGIRYLKRDFLPGLDVTAMTLEELNQEVLRWLTDTVDVRVHGITHERPIDRWPTEAATLQPPNARRDYDTSYLAAVR